MQNSDLKNVLISAIETADNRLLSMLYAVIKSYQITENSPATIVEETATPKAAQAERVFKDDRPRRVVRVYRKPQQKVAAKAEAKQTVVASTPKATPVVAPRVIRVSASSRNSVAQPAKAVKENAVSGKSNNGGFITDLMTKTVSGNALPA